MFSIIVAVLFAIRIYAPTSFCKKILSNWPLPEQPRCSQWKL